MTTVPVIYRLSVQGAADVASGLSGAAKSAAKGVDEVGNSFKKIANDIDSIGGKSAQAFSKMVDDVASVAAAVGTGGLATAATVAALAVGKWGGELSTALFRTENMIGAVRDLDTHYKSVSDAVRVVLDRKKEKTAADREEILVTREAIKAHADATIAITRMALAVAESRPRSIFIPELVKQLEEEKALRAKVVEAEIQASTAGLGVVIAREEHRKAVQYEATQAALEIIEDEEKKKTEIREKSATAEADARRRMFEQAQEDEARVYREREAAEERRNAAGQAALDKRARAFEAEKKHLAENAALQAQQNATLREYYAGLERAAVALRKKQDAERAAAAGTLLHAQAQNVVSAAQMVAQPIVSELTNSLRELGNVNRDNMDNYRIEARELPAIIAKKAQGILAGIAAEAAGRPIMEAGNAASEIAFGIAAIATPGLQATAPGHFAAAAQHGAASAIYATLAGGAAGGAAAIGFSRGSGGLVGLTKEERDADDRRRGRGGESSGGGGGGGSSIGGGGRGGSGPEGVVVNITYGSGAIAPADERRAAGVVASGVRRANQDSFERRRMRGAW